MDPYIPKINIPKSNKRKQALINSKYKGIPDPKKLSSDKLQHKLTVWPSIIYPQQAHLDLENLLSLI